MKTKRMLFIILIIFGLLSLWACQKEMNFEGRLIYDSQNENYRESPESWQMAAEMEIYKRDEHFSKSDEDGKFFFSLDNNENINNIAYAFSVEEPYEIVFVDSFFEKENKMILLLFIGEKAPPQEETLPEEEEIEETTEVLRLAKEEEQAERIRGYVTDSDYNRKEGVKIIFGESEEKAATSDYNGEFMIRYINPQNLSVKRIMDYLKIEIKGYKYTLSYDNGQEYTECFFVIEEESSALKLKDIVFSPLIKCSFGYLQGSEEVIFLPPGYPLDQGILDQGGIAAEADSFSGVSMYVNGKFVTKSNVYGFDIDFIIPGSEIKIERQGFSFGIRYGQSPVYEMENDTFIYDREYDLLEIRGFTEDEYALFD
ncbi:MAG: hypothetical protein ACOCWI_00390 [Bacillota bacterium]